MSFVKVKNDVLKVHAYLSAGIFSSPACADRGLSPLKGESGMARTNLKKHLKRIVVLRDEKLN